MRIPLKPVILSAALSLSAPLFAAELRGLDTDALIKARPTSSMLAQAGVLYNPEAPIPPQCYTKIEGTHNPCYVCHQNNADATRPNFMQDGSLQQAYEFSEAGLLNHHRNLFVDRTEDVTAISDAEILDYINQDNYAPLADALKARGWTGWMPDLADYAKGRAAFDQHGFALDGSGWVAFNYKPQPSTFWPTNGSTDDVLIRLPAAFRETRAGMASRDVYMANLALVEIAFQDLERVSLPAVDETAIGTDINGDGVLGLADTILRRDAYLGGGADVPVTRMLYPKGTEFLHSVRYVGIGPDGQTTTPARMKELRYMIKTRFLPIPELKSRYGNELQEKIDENLPRYIDLGDRGMDTGFGWTLLAFIEDSDGALRPQTNEEQLFCRGCHATMGANIDQTWAFGRKLRGAQGWGYIDYRAMRDVPNIGEIKGEIELYFERAGGGDEFRSNAEMQERWFKDDGTPDTAAMAGKTVYELITPSPERALQLNKAYRVIVREQSFVFGRDATLTPPQNVYSQIDDATAPTLPRDKRYSHDIRLDWSQ